MSEKKENSQLGARLDSGIVKWIRETAKEMKITQGEFVVKMHQAYVEYDITQRYPQWSAQIKDVHFWARSMVSAFEAQVEHSANADKYAREVVWRDLKRKEDLLEEQLSTINELKEETKQHQGILKRAEDLQRELDAARVQLSAAETDAKQRMEDLRTTIDGLMGDKKRLEAEVKKNQERIIEMQAAVVAFDAMCIERDRALAGIENAKREAEETVRQAMQGQIDAVNTKLHETNVALAAAQAEVSSLREVRDSNNMLREKIGAQSAKIEILEVQQKKAEEDAAELRERCVKQALENERLRTQIEMMCGSNSSTGGQLVI